MNATLELAAPHLLKVEAHHWDRPVSQHAQTRHGDLAATEPKPATGGSRHPRPLRTAALWAPERSCGPLEPRSVAWSLCEAPPKVADSAALYPPPPRRRPRASTYCGSKSPRRSSRSMAAAWCRAQNVARRANDYHKLWYRAPLVRFRSTLGSAPCGLCQGRWPSSRTMGTHAQSQSCVHLRGVGRG